MDFNTDTIGFCEGTLYFPEYINSITSLFLVLSGYIGLFCSKNTNPFGKLFFASIFVNGIGSFGYHWTNHIGWRYIDEFSMVILSLSAMMSTGMILLKDKSNLYSICMVVIVSYLVIALVFDALDNISVFRIFFGIFLGIICICMLYLIYLNNTIDKNILMYPRIGIVLLLLSSSTWLITETLCDRIYWIKYIPGHAIWHIGMSLCGYYLCQFIVYIMARDSNYSVDFNVNKPFNKLFPSVNYMDMYLLWDCN